MLGGGFLNSRLMARIRGKDGLSYGVGSQLTGDNFEKAGTFFIYAIYAPQNLAKLQQAINEEIASVLAEDFTRTRSTRPSPAGCSRAAWRVRRTTNSSARWAHWLFVGRTLAWDAEFEKKVMALDGAQIRAALKRHLDPSKFTIVKAGDFAGAAKKQAAPAAPAAK